MEKQSGARVITLTDLWEVFTQHIIKMIAVAILFVAMVFAYATFLLTPLYKSTAALYILKQDNTNEYSYTQSDFNLALNIVNDCTYMVKSHAVLDKAISNLNLDMSYKELYNSISINNPDNTRILEVSVETAYPAKSKEIVDTVCKYAISEINDTVGTNQINIHTKGTLEDKPSNSISMTKYALIGIAAAVATYSICLIAYILDDRIKGAEDVEKHLGLAVIGEISNIDAVKQQSKKYTYYSHNNNKNDNSKNNKGKHSSGGAKK